MKMTELLRGRRFQLWEYLASHGMLLIRSPGTQDFEQSVDMIFWGVIYVDAPRHLGEICLEEANTADIENLESKLGTKIELPDRVWVLTGLNQRSFIVACHMKIENFVGNYIAPRLHDILGND